MTQWDGNERRNATSSEIQKLATAIVEGRLEQREHFDRKIDELSEMVRSGFPNGDPIEHRKVHESYIREAKERSEMYRSLRDRLLSGGVLAVFGVIGGLLYWIGHAAWEAFKRDFLK